MTVGRPSCGLRAGGRIGGLFVSSCPAQALGCWCCCQYVPAGAALYVHCNAARAQRTWRPYQADLPQQEGLVRQLAAQEPCPWWAWALSRCVFTVLFLVCGLLAITVGQVVVLWTQPHDAQRFWLRVCVTFEVVLLPVIVWAGVVGIFSGTNRMVVAAAVGVALRALLKLLFDVQDKMGMTLWGAACCRRACKDCSTDFLRFFSFLMHGVFGGAWLLVWCRFKRHPWTLAVDIAGMPRPPAA